MRRFNIRGGALVVALSFAVLTLGCAAKPDDPIASVSAPLSLAVIHPQRGTAVRSITLPGDLVGYYESTLYAKVTGYVQSIAVDKGDRVRQGQVLAVIEVPELRQRLARALAHLEIERITYRRLDKVWNADSRLVAREDVDVAYAKFEEAKAEVAELRALESYTRITAPFDGVITGRFVDPGALVKIGGGGSAPADSSGFEVNAQGNSSHASGGSTPVLTEAKIDTLRTYVYVPQDAVPYIRLGTPATLTIRAIAGRQFTGTVTRFTHSLDLSTRTMLTEVDIQNPRHELYPGMYANVRLQLERHTGVFKLPDQSVDAAADGNFIFVVKNQHLDRVRVTTGINTGSMVEIRSGVSAVDQVVETYSPALTPGERVRPILPQALAHRNGAGTVALVQR